MKFNISPMTVLSPPEMGFVGGLPVLSGNKLVGIVTRTDILKVESSKRAEKRVEEIMSSGLAVALADGDLYSALTRMIARGVGRLPVVHPDNTEALVGIITRADIARASEKSRLPIA